MIFLISLVSEDKSFVIIAYYLTFHFVSLIEKDK